MKRDFSKVITDLKGKPVTEGASVRGILDAIQTVWGELSAETRDKLTDAMEKNAANDLTLATVCCNALLGGYEDERNLAGDIRAKRYRLAGKIANGGVVEITPDERDLIKPLLYKAYPGALIPVAAADVLEGEKPAEKTPDEDTPPPPAAS